LIIALISGLEQRVITKISSEKTLHLCPGKTLLFFLIFFFLSSALFCQESDTGTYVGTPYLSFKLSPGVVVPLLSSVELFSIGGKIELAAQYRLLPFLYAAAGLNYGILPVKSDTEEIANLLSLSVGTVYGS